MNLFKAIFYQLNNLMFIYISKKNFYRKREYEAHFEEEWLEPHAIAFPIPAMCDTSFRMNFMHAQWMERHQSRLRDDVQIGRKKDITDER